MRLPGGASLPVILEHTTAREYERVERAISAEEAQQRAEEDLQRRLRDEMHEDGEVLHSTLEAKESGDVYEITLYAECEEQIGRTVEFAK